MIESKKVKKRSKSTITSRDSDCMLAVQLKSDCPKLKQ
jgi:hypothetical protein